MYKAVVKFVSSVNKILKSDHEIERCTIIRHGCADSFRHKHLGHLSNGGELIHSSFERLFYFTVLH